MAIYIEKPKEGFSSSAFDKMSETPKLNWGYRIMLVAAYCFSAGTFFLLALAYRLVN